MYIHPKFQYALIIVDCYHQLILDSICQSTTTYNLLCFVVSKSIQQRYRFRLSELRSQALEEAIVAPREQVFCRVFNKRLPQDQREKKLLKTNLRAFQAYYSAKGIVIQQQQKKYVLVSVIPSKCQLPGFSSSPRPNPTSHTPPIVNYDAQIRHLRKDHILHQLAHSV